MDDRQEPETQETPINASKLHHPPKHVTSVGKCHFIHHKSQTPLFLSFLVGEGGEYFSLFPLFEILKVCAGFLFLVFFFPPEI